jgi:hypothetical protein
MTMAALLLAMHARPALGSGVIGFGSGLTTQPCWSDPRLTRVDTIEIEPKWSKRESPPLVSLAPEDSRSHVIRRRKVVLRRQSVEVRHHCFGTFEPVGIGRRQPVQQGVLSVHTSHQARRTIRAGGIQVTDQR